MREKTRTLEGSSSLNYTETYPEQRKQDEPRIDLNDLLKRVEKQKKIDKKTNLIVISGAIAVISIAALLISL